MFLFAETGCFTIPIPSMYGIFTYINHNESTIHVGKYTVPYMDGMEYVLSNILRLPNLKTCWLLLIPPGAGASADSFEAAKLILEVLQRLAKEVSWIVGLV